MSTNHNHVHDHCMHPKLRYCSHCECVYCVDCGKEWRDRWYYYYPNYYTMMNNTGQSIQTTDNAVCNHE